MKKISFIIPAFNEEGNIEELHKQINESIKSNNNYEFEYLFIENGSTDKTLDKIINLHENVRYIKLSRNLKWMAA